MAVGEVAHVRLGWEWVPPPLPDPSPFRQNEPRWVEPTAPLRPPGMSPKAKGLVLLGGSVFFLLLIGSSTVFIIPALASMAAGGVVLYRDSISPTNPKVVVSTRQDAWNAFLRTHEEWSAAIVRDESASQQIFDNAPRWYPIDRLDPARRLDIIGGSPVGWATLLRTGLAQLATAGAPMTVLDLSGREVSSALWADLGYQVEPRRVTVPADLASVDPLAGSTRPWDIIGVITAGGSDTRNDDQARRDMEVFVIRRVVTGLATNITVPRLLAAVTCLLAPTAPIVTTLLTPEERQRLEDPDFLAMLGRDGTVHLTRVAAVLETLLDGALPEAGSTPQPLPFFPESGISVVSAGRAADNETRRRLDNLLAAALVDQLDSGRQHGGLIAIVGADRLSRTVLEILIRTAEERVTRLLLFFEGLRTEARDLLGRGSSDTIIMRLGNYEDATAAANFVGKQHVFVVSSITLQVGSQIGGSEGHGFNVNESTGSSQTFQNLGGDSESVNSSRSSGANFNYSRTWSDTTSYGETSTRSEEFVARAEDLQRIPTTGFLYVSAINGRQHVIFGDCYPEIARSRFVAAKAIARR